MPTYYYDTLRPQLLNCFENERKMEKKLLLLRYSKMLWEMHSTECQIPWTFVFRAQQKRWVESMEFQNADDSKKWFMRSMKKRSKSNLNIFIASSSKVFIFIKSIQLDWLQLPHGSFLRCMRRFCVVLNCQSSVRVLCFCHCALLFTTQTILDFE